MSFFHPDDLQSCLDSYNESLSSMTSDLDQWLPQPTHSKPEKSPDMSLTARERHNPPPRRKSCAACIKAKRRCDSAVPECFRCAQRGITCVYQHGPAGHAQQHRQQKATTPVKSPMNTQSAQYSHATSSSSNSGGLYMGDVPNAASLVDIVGVSVGDPLLGPVQEQDSNLAAPDTHVSSFGSGCNSSPQSFEDMLACQSNFPSKSFFQYLWAGGAAQTNMTGQSSSSSSMTPPSHRDLNWTVERKIQYAVSVLRQAPFLMVQELQTPWCHRLLYEDGMPRSMQDAVSCCALYMAKTHINEPVVLSTIESRIQELVASPISQSPIECLARAQALLLYQIIRLFDGNIGARASAERHIPALDDAACCLMPLTTLHLGAAPNTELPLYPVAATQTFWHDWIFQESSRRTIFLSFYFVQAYQVLSGDQNVKCDSRQALIQTFTLSAHLWKAQTPLEFAEAWRDRRHFVMTDAVISNILTEARGEDLDRFGKMMISTLMGFDEAEGWFASRGSSLRLEDPITMAA